MSKTILPSGEVEEYTEIWFHYKCLLCGNESQTSIVAYDNIFEHDSLCIFCSSELDWVKEQMLSNGESQEDYLDYARKRVHNKGVLLSLKY